MLPNNYQGESILWSAVVSEALHSSDAEHDRVGNGAIANHEGMIHVRVVVRVVACRVRIIKDTIGGVNLFLI
jgi:hypothetical protein